MLMMTIQLHNCQGYIPFGVHSLQMTCLVLFLTGSNKRDSDGVVSLIPFLKITYENGSI